MHAILIAYDSDERDIFAFALRHVGLTVSTAADLKAAAESWLERPAELLLVAWHRADKILEDVGALRGVTQAPLLLIADSPAESLHCALLQAGVDLVLSRPVSARVLTEYVRTQLRRTQTVPTFVLPRLKEAEVKLDPDTRVVSVRSGEPRRLTQLEFRLLYVMMVNRGQVIPVDVIVERVWGYTGHGSRELVRGLVSRLRRKIEPDPGEPCYIHNVPGVGYRFTDSE